MPTPPSPITSTTDPGPTPAVTAACHPVAKLLRTRARRASSRGRRRRRGSSAVASAKGTRMISDWQPAPLRRRARNRLRTRRRPCPRCRARRRVRRRRTRRPPGAHGDPVALAERPDAPADGHDDADGLEVRPPAARDPHLVAMPVVVEVHAMERVTRTSASPGASIGGSGRSSTRTSPSRAAEEACASMSVLSLRSAPPASIAIARGRRSRRESLPRDTSRHVRLHLPSPLPRAGGSDRHADRGGRDPDEGAGEDHHPHHQEGHADARRGQLGAHPGEEQRGGEQDDRQDVVRGALDVARGPSPPGRRRGPRAAPPRRARPGGTAASRTASAARPRSGGAAWRSTRSTAGANSARKRRR